LFFQELRYDSVFTTTSGGFSGMPANLQKNGNIAQTAWRIKGRDMQAYNYTYDYLDRMLNSTYYNVAGTTATASNRYNENLTYDEKGNISTLNRRGYANTGVNTCTYDIIDNLNYTYNSEKSRLTSISDVANATYRPYGFSPGSGGVGYGYDANGNLKSDTYKGITNINYNHLNLPTIIQWGTSKSIEYTYDAGGNKLRKIVKTGVNTNAVKDYVAGIEYDTIPGSRIIESIYHSEGRYYNHTGTVTPTWRLEYSLRDHLGNTRISFSDLNSDGKIDVPSEILQENQYYAFGLEHEGNWKMTNIAEDMPYTYNGKEWNSEHNLKLYDYGARWYDPVVGRFTTVDPLADIPDNIGTSPYAYVWNNPLKFIDPDGRSGQGVLTDFLNTETGQTLHVEDGKDQIALVNSEQFSQVESLASMDSWNQQQSEQYETLSSTNVQGMDSDLGVLSRLTYSEMAQGNDNAKAIVAESAVNRTKLRVGAYENPDGTLLGAITKKGQYDVASSKSHRNDEFLTPSKAMEDIDRTNKVVLRPSFNSKTWLSSVSAAYNALNGSNVGKGVISYNSSNATIYDNNPKMQKINLSVNHKGVAGLWKLK